HYGEREFLKLVDRYGQARLPQLLIDYIDYTERLTRAEIGSLPEGTYRFEDWIDDDGMSEDPISLRLALTIKKDEVIADYTGSSPQVRGALNSTLSFTKANTYLTLRC